MKPDTDAEYHVSLRAPVRIKLQGTSTPFIAFDGRIDTAATDASSGTFRVDRIYLSGVSRDLKLSAVTVEIPTANIAGMIRQPFKE